MLEAFIQHIILLFIKYKRINIIVKKTIRNKSKRKRKINTRITLLNLNSGSIAFKSLKTLEV